MINLNLPGGWTYCIDSENFIKRISSEESVILKKCPNIKIGDSVFLINFISLSLFREGKVIRFVDDSIVIEFFSSILSDVTFDLSSLSKLGLNFDLTVNKLCPIDTKSTISLISLFKNPSLINNR